jgi:signal peptidase I
MMHDAEPGLPVSAEPALCMPAEHALPGRAEPANASADRTAGLRHTRIHRGRGGFLLHLSAFCEILICALFFVTFIAQPFRIPSESRTPTRRVGDFLLGDKQAFAPVGLLDRLLPPTNIERGDIIIFRYPLDPSRDLVKRVIGLPGDHIHLHAGKVFLNGLPLNEPYAVYNFSMPDTFRDDFPALRRTDPNADPAWWAELRRTAVAHEIIVPPGKYFVLGDNRNNSEDSRYWGYVPRQAIIARPLFVYFTDAVPMPLPQRNVIVRLLDGLRFGLRAEEHNVRIIR